MNNQISSNFFGNGIPDNNNVNPDDSESRVPLVGDRWVDILTSNNYIFTNTGWVRVFNGNLNDNPAIYNEYINAIVSMIIGNGLGGGSGFFITSDGFLMTAGHIFISEISGNVRTFSPSVLIYPENVVLGATLIGLDIRGDFALMKINLNDPSLESPLPPRKFFNLLDSRNVKIGTPVLVIGAPNAGLQEQAASFGIITNNIFSHPYILESVTASNNMTEGFSGSPLITLNGNVIGLVTTGFSET
jgi:serine protease Do